MSFVSQQQECGDQFSYYRMHGDTFYVVVTTSCHHNSVHASFSNRMPVHTGVNAIGWIHWRIKVVAPYLSPQTNEPRTHDPGPSCSGCAVPCQSGVFNTVAAGAGGPSTNEPLRAGRSHAFSFSRSFSSSGCWCDAAGHLDGER